MQEIQISIKDLLYRILLKWRILIIFTLVCALLGGAASYYLTKRADQTEIDSQVSVQTDEEVLKKKVSSAKKMLSEDEITDAEQVYNTYVQTESQKSQIVNYLSNSVKMQLDPEATPTVYLSYAVDTHYEAVYPVVASTDRKAEILSSYQSLVFSENLFDSISEQFGWNSADTKELLSASSDTGILVITIMAPDKEKCEKIASLVQERMDSLKTSLTEVYGDFDVSLVGKVFTEVATPSIITTRQNYLSNLNTVNNAYNTLYKTLTDKEKSYVTALIDYYTYTTLKSDSESTEDSESEKASNEVRTAEGEVNIIYVLAGAVGGLLVIFVLELLIYIFSSSVKTELDIEETLGLKILGTVSSGKKRKLFGFVDRAIGKLFYRRRFRVSDEVSLQLISSGIRISMEKSEFTRLHISGSYFEDVTDEVSTQIVSKLPSDGLSVTTGRSILLDPESLEKMASSDCAVIVEKLGSSRFDDIRKEIDLAKENGIKIIGAVAVY